MGVRGRTKLLAGAVALAGSICAFNLVAQSNDTRTISVRNIHNDEVVTVEYKRNGRYVPEAMERLNWVMRDWRRNEQIKMEPALIDLMWEIHRELGSRQPINLICGYRSRGTNQMLRRTVGGQASESRHILGKAADVQFPDVSAKQIRYAAMIRERGGVGYYPNSATPFVHIDTDRVRAWPRMPRFELALLFPNGHTQHKPAEGGDITPEDVRTARARQPDVARQLAAFHDMRRKGVREQPSVMTAFAPGPTEIEFTPAPKATPMPAQAAAPPAVAPRQPQLAAAPRLVERPVPLTAKPSDEDRRKLTQLVALVGMPQLVAQPALAARPQAPKQKSPETTGSEAGSLTSAESPFPRLSFLSAQGIRSLNGWSTGFASSPTWDDDHPEEVAYRPFPLASLLTTTASVDDPALAKMVHPDLARTGELFENPGDVEPMKLRPGREAAQLLWAQESTGKNVDLDTLSKASASSPAPRVAFARRVQTEAER